jgi:hypothetical protein
MNWDAVGAVGELVGAVAVIATLIYLAIQVKDSARAARSAAVTDATNAMQQFYSGLGNNPQTSELFLRGMANPESMAQESQFQFLMLLHSAFLAFQRSFFLAQEGTLDVGLRDSIGTSILTVNRMPGMRFYWRQRKSYFQPEFIEWVESLLAQDPVLDMDVYRNESSIQAE